MPCRGSPCRGHAIAPVLVLSTLVLLVGCDIFDSGDPSPAEIEVLDGHQESLIRAFLDTPPGVRVLDGRGRPMAGVAVEFQVVQGGGELTGALPSTDEDGEARVGAWRMGQQPGTNVISVVVQGLDPVHISAEARDPCLMVRAIGLGEALEGSLSPYHCRDDFGRPMELFDLTVSEQSLFAVRMSSDAFVPISGVIDESGFHVASNFQGHEGFARVAVVPGTYRIEARALDPATDGGDFFLELLTSEVFSKGCGPEYVWWVSHGVEMDGEITAADCLDDADEALEGERWDGYMLPYDWTVSIRFSVEASGPFMVSVWSHGRFRGAWRSDEGEEISVDLTPPSDVPTAARIFVSALPGTTYTIQF